MPGPTIYTRIDQVLTSCTTLRARISMLDTILNGMESALLTATTTGQFEEYMLDTGQTKSNIRYRTLTELQKSYEALFKMQQNMLNRLNFQINGRSRRLVDGKNFPGRTFYYGY